MFSGPCVFAIFGTGSLLVTFANEVEAINRDRQFLANYPTIYIGVTLLSIGILGCLKFMWDKLRADPRIKI